MKDPGHSAKSAGGRLQLNTHTPYLCGFEWCDTVTWCMVEWCTQNLHWNGSISHGTSHATPKERYQYTTSVDINNTRYKQIQSLIQNHMQMCTVSVAWLVPHEMLSFWRKFCVHHSKVHQVTVSLHSKPHRQGVLCLAKTKNVISISTPLPWILIVCAIKGYSHSFRITFTCQCVACAQWVCSRAENK